MTHRSMLEYATAVRPRYLDASRAEKTRFLNEFCQVTGYHRQSAIGLLRHAPKGAGKRRGKPKLYGPELVPPLRVAWEATDRIGSKRTAPFLSELIPMLERHQELPVSEATREKLMSITSGESPRSWTGHS
jgi:hypothetical protein